MADNYEYIPDSVSEEGYVIHGYSRWDCVCGNEIRRYRGSGDQECSNCGQWYNACGQRLRNDWMNNMSNYDEDISDMDGFEASQRDW